MAAAAEPAAKKTNYARVNLLTEILSALQQQIDELVAPAKEMQSQILDLQSQILVLQAQYKKINEGIKPLVEPLVKEFNALESEFLAMTNPAPSKTISPKTPAEILSELKAKEAGTKGGGVDIKNQEAGTKGGGVDIKNQEDNTDIGRWEMVKPKATSDPIAEDKIKVSVRERNKDNYLCIETKDKLDLLELAHLARKIKITDKKTQTEFEDGFYYIKPTSKPTKAQIERFTNELNGNVAKYTWSRKEVRD